MSDAIIAEFSRRRPPGCLHCAHSNDFYANSLMLTQRRKGAEARTSPSDVFAPLRLCVRFSTGGSMDRRTWLTQMSLAGGAALPLLANNIAQAQQPAPVPPSAAKGGPLKITDIK